MRDGLDRKGGIGRGWVKEGMGREGGMGWIHVINVSEGGMEWEGNESLPSHSIPPSLTNEIRWEC